MMLRTPKLFLLLVIPTFWGSQCLSANVSSSCDRISNRGFIHVRNTELSNIQDICKCESLRQLSFKKSKINALPKCVAKISTLESLNISKTNIERFPNEIPELSQLKNLDLAFTAIYFLPESLSKLKHLETLNLRGTKISSLPGGLEHLKRIDMQMIEMGRQEQEDLRSQYPDVKIYFSSPCNCK